MNFNKKSFAISLASIATLSMFGFAFAVGYGGGTTVPDTTTGAVTVSTSTPEVVVSSSTQPVNVTISSGTTNPVINVSSFISSVVVGTTTVKQGTLPAISILSADISNLTVAIPASTVVTSASTTWDGKIAAPTVTSVTLPTESGQTKVLGTAIEVGFVGAELTFDKAVKIVLPGQAGKKVGYTRNGGVTFTEITATCSGNDQTTGNALSAGAECKIDSASDLVIWTKHFTSFASYTQTATVSSGGGGSSGGSWFVGATQAVSNVATQVAQAVTNAVPTLFAQTTPNTPKGKVLGATTFNFEKNLRMGLKGNDVIELQKLLIEEGFLKTKATGYFGALTKSALAKWQAKNGLPATGYFGAMSRAHLQKASN